MALKFKASENQMIEIARLAISAASPAGLGNLRHLPGEISKEEILGEGNPFMMGPAAVSLCIDYFRGRQVKLLIESIPQDLPETVREWKLPADTGLASWASKYPTYEDLIRAAIPDVNFEAL